MNKTNTAERDNNGTLKCYLNPTDPKQGAYLYLNNPVGLEKPEDRIFRYYEAWVMLVAPAVTGGIIFLYICVVFIQVQFGKEEVKKPKKAFGELFVHSEFCFDLVSLVQCVCGAIPLLCYCNSDTPNC